MGRKISFSNRQQLESAVAFLNRARRRIGSDFFVKPGQAESELAKLEQLLLTLKDEDAFGVFGPWMDLHITQSGRVKLLGALRRKRADAQPGREKRRVISVTPAVYKELERLSKATGGIPMPRMLESLAAIANVDKKLQEKLFKLSVALSLK